MEDIEITDTIFIITAFPTEGAGSGALISTQAKSYVQAGYKVLIITANNRTDFKKIDGVKYKIVPFTSEGENPEKIEGQLPFNYPMFTTHTESTTNFWNMGLNELEMYCQQFKKVLAEEIKENKPYIIHAQHNWLLSSEATRLGIPVITTIHGTDLMGYEKSQEYLQNIEEQIKELEDNQIFIDLKEIFSDMSLSYKELFDKVNKVVSAIKNKIDKKFAQKAVEILSQQRKYRFYISEAENSARNSDKIVVISEDQKMRFENPFPYAADKVELIENGYDSKTFYVDKKVEKEEVLSGLTSYNTDDGKIPTDYTDLILFVGKFADFKGIDALLAASKLYEDKMQEEGKKPLTIIVGSGVLDEKLKEQAQRLGLKNTHFVGRQGHDVIRNLQNLATVSLIPSRNEPFGLVVIEGTACGHPVIASCSGGIPYIMNVSKKELPDEDIIQTPLGLLIKPLPERPSITDEKKERLDYATVDYMLEGKEKRQSIVESLSKEIDVGTDELEKYFINYELSVNALAESVIGTCDKKYVFDNNEIAEYTKKVYSQDVIRDRFIKMFKDVRNEYDKKQKSERD